MNSAPILYSFRRCPYAMRARMAVLVSGVVVHLREVVLRDKPAELLAVSAKATVPVLVLPNGQVIDESIDIMHWALAQNDPFGWLKDDDNRLILTNDGPFKSALDRYKYPHRYASVDHSLERQKGLDWLLTLNKILSKQQWLTRDTCALSDIAIFPFVRQFAATDRAWFEAQNLDHVRIWLDRLTGAELFETAMTRFAAWKNGDPPTLFHQDQFLSH
jgi:glutathione S-transferase